MEIKKGLVGLTLGSFLALGSAERAKASYIETFDSPSALDNWTLSDSSKFQQTTFQGNGVLRFEQSPYEYAFVPIQRQRGKPFTLEWDSFLVTPNLNNSPIENTFKDVFKFGLFSSFLPDGYLYVVGDNDAILAGSAFGEFSSDPSLLTTSLHYFPGTQASPLNIPYTASGGQTLNLHGMWLHNVLKYDSDNVYSSDPHLHFPFTLESVFGEGTFFGDFDASGLNAVNLHIGMRDDETLPSIDFDSYEPFIRNFKADKLGFAPPVWRGDYTAVGYIDNIRFTEIPEPSTSLLVGAGLGLAGIINARRKVR